MKTYSFVLAFFSFASAVCSCNKGSSDTKEESNFTWTYDDKTYKAKQDTAFTIGIGAPSIVAGLNTGFYDRGSGPRINATGLTEGASHSDQAAAILSDSLMKQVTI